MPKFEVVATCIRTERFECDTAGEAVCEMYDYINDLSMDPELFRFTVTEEE